MNELVIRLKSGREFTVICEECFLTRNGFGVATNIRFEGLQNIKPIILDPSQIELMYEVLLEDHSQKPDISGAARLEREATEGRSIQGTGDCDHCSRLFKDCPGR